MTTFLHACTGAALGAALVVSLGFAPAGAAGPSRSTGAGAPAGPAPLAVDCPEPSLLAIPFYHNAPCNLWSADTLTGLSRALALDEAGRAVVDTVEVVIRPVPAPPESTPVDAFTRDRLVCFFARGIDEVAPALGTASYDWRVRRVTLAELVRSPCRAVHGSWQARVAGDRVLLRLTDLFLRQMRLLAQEMALLDDEEKRLSGIFGRPYERPMIPNPNLGFTDEAIRLSAMAMDLAGAARRFLAAAEARVTGRGNRSLFTDAWVAATLPTDAEWVALGVDDGNALLVGLFEHQQSARP